MGNVSAQNTSMEILSTDSTAAIALSSYDELSSPRQPVIYVTRGTIITNTETINAKIVILETLEVEKTQNIVLHKLKLVSPTHTQQSEKEVQHIVVANNSVIKFHLSHQSSEEFSTSSEVSKGSVLSQIPNGKIKAILSYNLYYYNRFATMLFYTNALLYNSDSRALVFKARPPPAIFLNV